MFRLRAEEKGLFFTLNCADDLPPYILADLGKLRQVLINLLGNAIKFTKQGNIALSAIPNGPERITIEVKDTGIGISLEEQKKLFRSFQRTRTAEDEAGGTGLGLAISQAYAHLMDGQISVESLLGQGSCFRFEFHAAISDMPLDFKKSNKRIIALTPGQGQIRVLIVDDRADNRILLREMLEPLGFIVDEACSGQEAIEKVAAHSPRIILMDLVMPGMSGAKATQILRENSVDKSIVIIGISASTFEMDKQAFLDTGINDFIAKPFREHELYDILTRHAGVVFETQIIQPSSGSMQISAEKPTLEKMSMAWKMAFKQMLLHGNISRIRRLGEEAKQIDPILANWILEKAARYDLDGLKQLDNDHQKGDDREQKKYCSDS